MKSIFITVFLSLFFGSSVFGQTQKREEVEEIFVNIENPAVFEGGMDNFYKIVDKNLRSVDNKTGKVFVQFLVDTTGKTSNFKIIKGLSEKSDSEVLRLMKWMSKNYTWKPATRWGKPIEVKMNIPIIFRAENTIPTKLEMPIIDKSDALIGCTLPIHNDTIQIKEDENQDKIYTIVENSPIFEGGIDNFYKIVMENLNVTKDTQMSTRVFIEFVIDTTGKMIDIKLLRSNFSEKNNAEILKTLDFINENYTWQPAMHKGKKVFVRRIFPITMRFSD